MEAVAIGLGEVVEGAEGSTVLGRETGRACHRFTREAQPSLERFGETRLWTEVGTERRRGAANLGAELSQDGTVCAETWREMPSIHRRVGDQSVVIRALEVHACTLARASERKVIARSDCPIHVAGMVDFERLDVDARACDIGIRGWHRCGTRIHAVECVDFWSVESAQRRRPLARREGRDCFRRLVSKGSREAGLMRLVLSRLRDRDRRRRKRRNRSSRHDVGFTDACVGLIDAGL